MTSWLVQEIKRANQSWEPSFSFRSSYHWIQALDFEISSLHGTQVQSIYDSIRKSLAQADVRRADYHLQSSLVFEPLLHSLIYGMSLASIKTRASNSWMIPSAVIAWYYSCFFSLRSVIYCSLNLIPQTHAITAKAFNLVRKSMPHPIDMVAELFPSREYHATFPCFPGTTPYNLTSAFTKSRNIARGMMIQYLKGTADRHVRQVKLELRSKDRTITNFRSSQAKARLETELRNLPEINFLHCAYRYRRKAYHRDGVYLTLGDQDNYSSDLFLNCLRNTTRFVILVGLAYCTLKLGVDAATSFVKDLKNIRGIAGSNSEEYFWNGLLLS